MWKIAAAGSHVTREMYEEIFPGCRVKEWQPVQKKIRSKRMIQAIEVIKEQFKRTSKPLHPHTVYTAIEMSKTNFCKMRRDKQFIHALEDMGIEERRQGNGAWAFELSYVAYGFGPEVEHRAA
jgi:hypothetical protein